MFYKHKDITILGIESSCDDTSAAIIQNGKMLSNCIANQKIHREYGGVVPELASREHQKNIVPVVDQALKKAKIAKEELSAIAFTEGPGLLGSLLVGANFAKSMGVGLRVPIIGVHHMKAHIMAHFINEPQPKFPFLCLTVSGGHTQIVRVQNPVKFEVLGSTIDDAAGECFDKIAKILGFPYPGGPEIDRLAQAGNPDAFEFTEPNMNAYNYSFSGLKTHFLYFVQKKIKENPDFIQENTQDLCASIQKTIINILLRKLVQASKDEELDQIAIAGGVAANKGLRKRLNTYKQTYNWKVFIPEFQYCTDNAGMIAMMGHYQYEAQDFAPSDIIPQARLKM